MRGGDGPRSSAFQYLLTGLETGVLAVLAMLFWLGLSATWYRKSFWTNANLLSATFYGESALRNRFTVHTFAGLALYLVIYGSLGMLFGLAIQNRQPSLRTTCFGILGALAWYFLLFGWIWKRWDPLLVVYTHDRSMFAAHVVYGAILGSYPRNRLGRQERKEDAVGEISLTPPADREPAGGDLEVKS